MYSGWNRSSPPIGLLGIAVAANGCCCCWHDFSPKSVSWHGMDDAMSISSPRTSAYSWSSSGFSLDLRSCWIRSRALMSRSRNKMRHFRYEFQTPATYSWLISGVSAWKTSEEVVMLKLTVKISLDSAWPVDGSSQFFGTLVDEANRLGRPFLRLISRPLGILPVHPQCIFLQLGDLRGIGDCCWTVRDFCQPGLDRPRPDEKGVQALDRFIRKRWTQDPRVS